MAKPTRLYRLESISGKGLYQGDERLGSRVYTRTIFDVDLYRNGELRSVNYLTRGGESKKYQPPLFGFDFVMPLESRSNQLILDLDWQPPKREDIFKQLGESMVTYPSYGRGFSLAMEIDPQLTLDVTHERVPVAFETHQGDGLSLCEVIEQNFFPDGLEEALTEPTSARPMPAADGIVFPDGSHYDWYYAFKTPSGISNWLDGVTPQQCISCGGTVKIVEVRKAMHGKCQSVYREKDVIRTISIRARGL